LGHFSPEKTQSWNANRFTNGAEGSASTVRVRYVVGSRVALHPEKRAADDRIVGSEVVYRLE
jgi:hypothetical protein